MCDRFIFLMFLVSLLKWVLKVVSVLFCVCILNGSVVFYMFLCLDGFRLWKNLLNLVIRLVLVNSMYIGVNIFSCLVIFCMCWCRFLVSLMVNLGLLLDSLVMLIVMIILLIGVCGWFFFSRLRKVSYFMWFLMLIE